MTFNIGKPLTYAVIGAGFGSITYIISLLIQGVETQSVVQIANVLWISAVIGLVTMIYEYDRPALLWQILLHFISVYALVTFMNYLNDGFLTPLSLPVLMHFSLIYFVIWFAVYVMFYRRVEKINRNLQERRQENKS
ncbi:DUF3021 domain-containing protein [Streptococcus dentapri]|uniref:DUF3021 domain-containing protein n=1 Tax=Streptococcus dentapri TaxID=573564 RepID=A0ABV8D175_9STRE